VRAKALALAERYREEPDPGRYHDAGRALARQPYLNRFQYQLALRQARAACQLAPDRGDYLTTLGMAQYRLGDYREALATLTEADRVNHEVPADLAFLSMAQHRLGQEEQARATLTRLREVVKQPPWANDEEVQTFLGEAGALLQGAKP
jgi:tetratricopeptide (TPR) repeat protein